MHDGFIFGVSMRGFLYNVINRMGIGRFKYVIAGLRVLKNGF